MNQEQLNQEMEIELEELGMDFRQAEVYYEYAKKGVEYITQAAKLGNAQALWTLSYIYKKENSVVEKDLEKALEYAEKAYTELKNQG